MTRSGFQFPISDAGRSAAALDRQIEASLRRQFEVPAPMANPGELVPARPIAGGTAGGGWSLNFSFPRSITLRQAAGFLLAAALWGGAGVLVFQFAQVARPVATVVRMPNAFDPNNPIAHFVTAFARTRYDDDSPVALDAAMHQDELWHRLEVELAERCGSEVGSQVAKLRDSSDDRIQLLVVNEAFASNAELLFVAARVDGHMSAALFESGEDALAAHLPRAGIAERKASADRPTTHLYKTHVDGVVGYELNALEQPVLVPLLVPDMQLQMSLPILPERYRRVYAALLVE